MFSSWLKSGSPWVWLSAMTVSISLLMVFGLISMLVIKGFGHFWPADVAYFESEGVMILGEVKQKELIPPSQRDGKATYRQLVKTGNRDVTGRDFQWFEQEDIDGAKYPPNALIVERYEWGNFYGFLKSVKSGDHLITSEKEVWDALQKSLSRVERLHSQIEQIEKSEIGSINYRLEQLRLKERKLALSGQLDPVAVEQIDARRKVINDKYTQLQAGLSERYAAITRDSIVLVTDNGQIVSIPLQEIVRVYRPNLMSVLDKVGFYLMKLWEFVSDEPREANTEGGIFPAIYGTVLMVFIMSLLVTPFGVIAAIYLREYASQGPLVRLIRIAVNNLAGVPSIVYGVFGLGFFVYFLGSNIDQLFFPEALPAPTFGTPGLMWASITLAILTVPVVIVATEEGLSRVPRNIREGSLALGATKAETLVKTVIPMASPAIMTGMILAIARAAGEVAPLMLVGVVKLAPSLPLDMNYPFLHLDRKFMHLGFHIYDVGFQSPNVEAARPLVYATALLLVIVIVVLNLAAISIRNHLREKNRALETA